MLDEYDSDLGSGGPMAIPDGYGTTAYPHLLVQEGKDGHVYLLNRDAFGGLGQGPGGTDNALGVTGPYNGLWGHPAFWGGGGNGGYVYTVENAGYLRAQQLTSDANGVPSLTSVATSTATFGYTSGSPIVTSDGDSSTAALVWVVSVNGSTGADPVLEAYNAMPNNGVMDKVWSAPLDPPGLTPSQSQGAKFATVATSDGRVYVGTRDGYVFGFGHPSTASLDASPTDFGNVPVLNTSSLPVTLTATRAVTVTGASAGAPFIVTEPDGVTLPAVLAAGDTLTVNVTFAPLVPGQQSQNLVLNTTEGTKTSSVTFDLDGYGTEPGLSVTPGVWTSARWSSGRSIPPGSTSSTPQECRRASTRSPPSRRRSPPPTCRPARPSSRPVHRWRSR